MSEHKELRSDTMWERMFNYGCIGWTTITRKIEPKPILDQYESKS